jgi:hypothetical protein
MIEFRQRPSTFLKTKWRLWPNSNSLKDVNFGSYAYRINGEEFWHRTERFEQEFKRALIWHRLQN